MLKGKVIERRAIQKRQVAALSPRNRITLASLGGNVKCTEGTDALINSLTDSFRHSLRCHLHSINATTIDGTMCARGWDEGWW